MVPHMQKTERPLGAADLLRQKFEEIGVTQKEVAADADIHPSTLSQMMKGRKPFTRAALERVANVTDLKASALREAEDALDKWRNSIDGKMAIANQRLENLGDWATYPFLTAPYIKAYLEAGALSITPAAKVEFVKTGIRLTRGDCVHYRRKLRLGTGDENEVVEEITENEVTNGKLTVKPGESVRIKSAEKVRLPGNLACRVVGMRVHMECSHTAAAAEDFTPPFDNHLTIVLTNNGCEPLELDRGETCMFVSFFAFTDLIPET